MEMIQNFRKRSRVNTDIGKFFNSIEEVRRLINDLKLSVEDVKKRQSEILAIPVPNDTRTLELDDINAKIKSASVSIRTKLKAIEKDITDTDIPIQNTIIEVENHGETVQLNRNGASSRYVPVAVRIRKTQHSTLLKQFTDVMSEYQMTQVTYRDQIRARLKRQLEITNASYSEDDLDNMIDKGNVTVFTKSIIIDTKVAKQNLEDIQSRHNDLMKLEKSIKDLAELFQEIAQRVEIQGTVVDNIAINVQKTSDYVEGGAQKFKEAQPFQKSLRKKNACLLTTGCLVLTVILIVLIVSAAQYWA